MCTGLFDEGQRCYYCSFNSYLMNSIQTAYSYVRALLITVRCILLHLSSCSVIIMHMNVSSSVT